MNKNFRQKQFGYIWVCRKCFKEFNNEDEMKNCKCNNEDEKKNCKCIEEVKE